MIARERTAAAVRAVLAGREAHDHDASRGVAKCGYGLAEISGLLAFDRIQELGKTGATAAAGVVDAGHRCQSFTPAEPT